MFRYLIGAAMLLLTACASYGPTDALIGRSQADVIALLGAPARESVDEGRRRLDFLRGPYGKQSYFVYLDDKGRVLSWRQVLTEENFLKILPGMSREEVIKLIGESRVQFGLARDRGYVWSYRYETAFCQWFQIEFTKNDIVRSTGHGTPPECEVHDDRR